MNTEHKTETIDKEVIDKELIAIWDGWEKRPYWNGYFWKHPILCSNSLCCHILDMKYKTSFDWIMPVVEKINSGDISRIHIHEDVVHYHLLEWQKIPINGDLIGAIYKAVVIVLRWAENKK